MNEFHLYEQLCTLEDIANQYPEGREYGKSIRELADRIVSRIYRVAVIGEFKRGKSSLVNAIIGAQVLPTDILPMTATVTRVTYGEKRKICVLFKDGHEEERTVAELVDFATKLDAEKEKTAAQIREIQVDYPSVFCKNHIDIIDTPGLGDAMKDFGSMVSQALHQADAVVYVFSVNYPLSQAEQLFLKTEILPQKYTELFLVGNYADMMSNEQDYDRMQAEVHQLSGWNREDLTKYYSFYCVDTLQEAMNRCVEHHTLKIYDLLDKISGDLLKGLSRTENTRTYSFTFALDNRTWTNGDNVSYVVNAVGLTGFGLIMDGITGAMRQKELQKRAPEVLDRIKEQYSMLRGSALQAVENTYQQMGENIKKQLDEFYSESLETAKERVEQSAMVARQDEEKKAEIRSAIAQIRAVLKENEE